MRAVLITAAAVLALAGCSDVAEPEATSVDPLPLVVDGSPEHSTDDSHDHAAGDTTDAATGVESADADAGAATATHDTDVTVATEAADIDPDVLAAMIVIVAGGDVDGAIDAGEFSDVDVLEALDHLAGVQG